MPAYPDAEIQIGRVVFPRELPCRCGRLPQDILPFLHRAVVQIDAFQVLIRQFKKGEDALLRLEIARQNQQHADNGYGQQDSFHFMPPEKAGPKGKTAEEANHHRDKGILSIV